MKGSNKESVKDAVTCGRAIMDSLLHVRRFCELARANLSPACQYRVSINGPILHQTYKHGEGILLYNIALFLNTDSFANYLVKIKFSLYQHPIQLLEKDDHN